MSEVIIDDIAIVKLALLSMRCDNCKYVELIDVSEHTKNYNIISMCGLTGGYAGKVCQLWEKRNEH
jgi:hypothetical protein